MKKKTKTKNNTPMKLILLRFYLCFLLPFSCLSATPSKDSLYYKLAKHLVQVGEVDSGLLKTNPEFTIEIREIISQKKKKNISSKKNGVFVFWEIYNLGGNRKFHIFIKDGNDYIIYDLNDVKTLFPKLRTYFEKNRKDIDEKKEMRYIDAILKCYDKNLRVYYYYYYLKRDAVD